MKLHDISLLVHHDMDKYPSLQPMQHIVIKDYANGDDCAVSKVDMVLHIGTHLDSPYHYIRDGKKITDLSLEIFYGKALVVESESRIITPELVKNIPDGTKRVLFKTPFSQDMHDGLRDTESSYFTKESIDLMAGKGVILIGIDAHSVDKVGDKSKVIHKTVLSKGIVALEEINLYGVEPKEYIISCFPIKIKDAEGSPCRAVLIEVD